MELDRVWMDTRGPIQIVHDIETGYGDPLRVKATPDFSLRFLDDTYRTQNATIKTIQTLICDYYKGLWGEEGISGTKWATAGASGLLPSPGTPPFPRPSASCSAPPALPPHLKNLGERPLTSIMMTSHSGSAEKFNF